jgi:hypothetical protein
MIDRSAAKETRFSWLWRVPHLKLCGQTLQ